MRRNRAGRRPSRRRAALSARVRRADAPALHLRLLRTSAADELADLRAGSRPLQGRSRPGPLALRGQKHRVREGCRRQGDNASSGKALHRRTWRPQTRITIEGDDAQSIIASLGLVGRGECFTGGRREAGRGQQALSSSTRTRPSR